MLRTADYASPGLGHSNLIVEIDGYRVLIDPIWGERPSPISWLGPTRWYESPLALEELPRIDAVLISHDHYDHLDHQTVLALLEKQIPWVVPLGVGAHLQAWGMDNAHITELDWWASYRIGDLELTATPARHFSGRGFDGGDQNGGPTLWAGWSIAGPKHRVYYSGDTALFDALTDIGERLGPFDLTLIETGAYNRSNRPDCVSAGTGPSSHNTQQPFQDTFSSNARLPTACSHKALSQRALSHKALSHHGLPNFSA